MKRKQKDYKHRMHRLLQTCFLSFILFIPITAKACPADTSTDSIHTYRLDKKYFKSYWFDARNIALSPFHWKGRQWIAFAGVTAVSLFVYTKDEQVQQVFQKNRSHAGDQFVRYALEPWGSSGLYTLPLLGVIYLDGILGNRERSKKTALLGVKAFIVSNLYARIPKYAFQRHRPDQDNPGRPTRWEGPLHGITGYTSFPSGHAVTSFAVATVIASEYKERLGIGMIAYALAGVVSLSRVYDNRHWASDALIGAAFGYAMGKMIYNQDSWMNGGKRKKNIRGMADGGY